MESDNQKLLRLVGALPISPEALQSALQELREQVDKCQNEETCDGSVATDVWNMANTVTTHLEHVLLGIKWAKKRYLGGGGE